MVNKYHFHFIRRVVAIVLIATLLVFIPTPAPIACNMTDAGMETSITAEASTFGAAGVCYYYVVTTPAGLNVRSGPGTNYKKVGILNGGTVFRVLDSKNGWLKISKTKWVCRDYCAKCDEFLDLNSELRHGVIVKTSGSNRLNLRSGPSESFSILAKIPNGTRLNPSFKYNGWYYVIYKGYTGWVSKKYTKMDY